jgi:hypothetical protein
MKAPILAVWVKEVEHMHHIHPICNDTIKPHMGKHVCVVLLDGTEVYGTLGGLEGNQLVLNSCFPCDEGGAANIAGAKGKGKGRGKQAQTSAYGFYGPIQPYGGRFLFDLALIAFLFAIPFFFV